MTPFWVLTQDKLSKQIWLTRVMCQYDTVFWQKDVMTQLASLNPGSVKGARGDTRSTKAIVTSSPRLSVSPLSQQAASLSLTFLSVYRSVLRESIAQRYASLSLSVARIYRSAFGRQGVLQRYKRSTVECAFYSRVNRTLVSEELLQL